MCNKCNSDTTKYYENFERILDRMICCMTGADLGRSISGNFISQMIPHHRAAIEMSENVLNFTDNCEVRQIANTIIREQEEGIEDMQEIFNRCNNRCQNCNSDLCSCQRRLNDIINTMFSRMRSAKISDSVACDFLRQMIPHHEGAVKMCETVQQYCICDELRPMLAAIIRQQKKGIREMKDLLCSLGCE